MRLFENQTVVSDGVLFCAFRYALGRMTYVVPEVAEAIEQNLHNIQPKLRHLMVKEISEAIEAKSAGMDMDVDRWKSCRKAIQQSLTKEEKS